MPGVIFRIGRKVELCQAVRAAQALTVGGVSGPFYYGGPYAVYSTVPIKYAYDKMSMETC